MYEGGWYCKEPKLSGYDVYSLIAFQVMLEKKQKECSAFPCEQFNLETVQLSTLCVLDERFITYLCGSLIGPSLNRTKARL